MRDYIDYVLKRGKKPVELEKIYENIEKKKKETDSSYSLSDADILEINRLLDEGVKNYEYYKTPNGNYTLISKTSFRKGSFRGNRNGGGTVFSSTVYIGKNGVREIRDEKYTIDKEFCSNAVDGDIILMDTGYDRKKPSVLKVLERNIDEVVGEVTKIGNMTYVIPINKRQNPLTIYLNDAVEDGSLVSVSLSELNKEDIEKFKETTENHYIGKVSEVFTSEDDPHYEALKEAFKCGMPYGFSEESLKQAANIPDHVRPSDKNASRWDFTEMNVFSIDGEDTKDKDDAISLEVFSNGHYLLGVHIADVNYYVKEGTPIDLDAFRKGTSYYFDGCVVPQLPPELSNGICSLNEGVERLTKSVLIEFDENGNVVNRLIVPGVIKSKKSLTYEKVNELFEGKEVDGYIPFNDGYIPFKGTLANMKNLADLLRKNRKKKGAIIFNRPEVRFKYDEFGKPIDVCLRKENIAEMIIEEFMLAANNNVAEILSEGDMPIPVIYRIHDVPKIEGISDFLNLLKAINMPFEFDAEDVVKDREILQLLAAHINRNELLAPMLNANLVRCMSRASYNTINIGHFGTGFDIYCHFTSPIRRLADLANSRIIDECYFEKNPDIKAKNIIKWKNLTSKYATQATNMERVSEEVEKNVLYMNMADYFSNYIGEEFEGSIVTLSDKGISVQLDNLLEGKIRNRYLEGDYAYNQETYTLVSLNGRSNYYVGDRLRMKLVGTSTDTKTVDFKVLEKIKENSIRDRHKSNQYVKSRAQEHRNRRPYN